MSLIMQQIDNFKQKLGNIYEFNFNESNIDNSIDLIVNSTSKIRIIEKLNILYTNLYKTLNSKTFIRLNKLNILPLKL